MSSAIMTSFVDDGNWSEVSAALARQGQGSRGIGSSLLDEVIAANARAAEEAYFGPATRALGGSVVRAFWWGFHIQVSHEDLASALNATDPNGEIVRFLRRVLPQDYQRWIDVITPFVVAGATMLRGLDRGRGVYISMSWFAPGLFIPTSV